MKSNNKAFNFVRSNSLLNIDSLSIFTLEINKNIIKLKVVLYCFFIKFNKERMIV